MKEVHTINYYPINEGAARRAKEMNSFSDYKEGSATAEYRAMVDKAAAVAEKQKSRVDPMYHEKIDHLLDTYARKLAENMNQGFAIDARVPSVMIAGPSNFPVGKKEKQNRARDSNMEEWRHIQGLLDKIRSTGMGGISADDPAAIEKLQKKLDGLERSQLIMKEVNAYYRKHGKLDGCALLSPDQIEKLKASMARSIKEVHTINYYPINEGAARRAKEMNSFSDYKEGSATAEYRAMVDKAAAIAEQQKSRVDPMYHEKIDHLLDAYARKLAENMNQGFAIDARVPSMMIAGPANFPVGKKEKQNRARDSNMEEWRYIQGLLDKIRSTGMGGISADDPAAIEKLQKKLDGLERSQLIMKEVNAYYRKHGKLDGCALLSPDQIEKLKASMASSWRSDPRPFESYQLTNNNAEIRRVKARIEQLSKQAQQEFSGWEFDGGRVEMNREDNRLQVFFDGKPDADTRAELKSSGFRWAPSVGAWQRQLTDNAIRAADRLECIKPLSGEKPSQLQKKPSILQTMREQDEKVQTEPEKKAPSGRDAER